MNRLAPRWPPTTILSAWYRWWRCWWLFSNTNTRLGERGRKTKTPRCVRDCAVKRNRLHAAGRRTMSNVSPVIPHAGSPSIQRSGAKRCCFKPHAVKVVYLFVTSDVTTHPCLTGSAFRVTSTGAGQSEPSWKEMSPTTTRETRRARLWLATGGAGGEIPLSRRGPLKGAVHNKKKRKKEKVMAIYLGPEEGGIILVGLS